MPAYADLELSLRRSEEGKYAVDLRLNLPDSDAETSLIKGGPGLIELDPTEISGLSPAAYGKALSAAVFQDKVGQAFSEARKAVDARDDDAILRLRLNIDASAAELHSVHWETITDPETGEPLLMGDRIAFSRYLSSNDWRPVKTRPQSKLKALVVVANPTDLQSPYKMAVVDVAGEVERATAALKGIQVETLTSASSEGKAPHERSPGGVTLDNIVSRLRDGFDILYLVCHGSLSTKPDGAKEAKVYLEKAADDARTIRASGIDLARRIQDLPERPRLIVLASCESGGTGSLDDPAAVASALGPQLAQAGVPAVVAMRGQISMDTVTKFMPKFFERLAKDGQIDQAMSVARRTAQGQSDYWMPVLYMRLRRGRIWYTPGFEKTGKMDQLDTICGFAERGDIVPIIGPDLAEQIFGSSRDIASEIATAEGFPFSANDRSDPAKVMQYVFTKTSLEGARLVACKAISKRLQRKTKDLFGSVDKSLSDDELLQKIADKLAQDEDNPFRILAGLNAKVFVNASADPLITLLLKRMPKPKEPLELVCKWRDERKESSGDPEVLSDPTAQKPIVYHVFGQSTQPESWVLTEDDFMDYLIKVSSFKQMMPGAVSDALVTKSLLFLGFSLDDWKFRILFRMIMAKGGSALLMKRNHVGVQLNPDETTLADADRAKKYLASYFREGAKVDVYWGSSADFLKDLKTRLAELVAAE